MSTKFTMPVHTLTQLVGVATHSAADDPSLPVLTMVKFTVGEGAQHIGHYDHRLFSEKHWVGSAVTLAATDRYRLSWATAGCIPTVPIAEPVEFLLRADALRKMVASFPKPGRAPRRRDSLIPHVVVEVDGTWVRFTVGQSPEEPSEYQQSTTLAKSTSLGAYPKLERVVVFGHGTEPVEEFAVNPVYAAQMFAAFAKVRRYRDPVVMSPIGAHKPVRFSMSTEGDLMASGLLMPVKDNT